MITKKNIFLLSILFFGIHSKQCITGGIFSGIRNISYRFSLPRLHVPSFGLLSGLQMPLFPGRFISSDGAGAMLERFGMLSAVTLGVGSACILPHVLASKIALGGMAYLLWEINKSKRHMDHRFDNVETTLSKNQQKTDTRFNTVDVTLEKNQHQTNEHFGAVRTEVKNVDLNGAMRHQEVMEKTKKVEKSVDDLLNTMESNFKITENNVASVKQIVECTNTNVNQLGTDFRMYRNTTAALFEQQTKEIAGVSNVVENLTKAVDTNHKENQQQFVTLTNQANKILEEQQKAMAEKKKADERVLASEKQLQRLFQTQEDQGKTLKKVEKGIDYLVISKESEQSKMKPKWSNAEATVAGVLGAAVLCIQYARLNDGRSSSVADEQMSSGVAVITAVAPSIDDLD